MGEEDTDRDITSTLDKRLMQPYLKLTWNEGYSWELSLSFSFNASNNQKNKEF